MADSITHRDTDNPSLKVGVQVDMLWGDHVVATRQWRPQRALWLGESAAGEPPCDFPLDEAMLGARRRPLLVSDGAGDVCLVVLPGGEGTIELPKGQTLTLDEALEVMDHEAHDEPMGAYRLPLPSGATVLLRFGKIVLRVSVAPAERRLPRRSWGRSARWLAGGCALSLALHGGLAIAGCASSAPEADPVGMTDEQRYLVQYYLDGIEERRLDETVETELVQGDNREGGAGTRAKGAEGTIGDRLTGHRYGVSGPRPEQSRQAALQEAAEFGMIGLLNSGAGGDPDAPTAPWGRDDSLGRQTSGGLGLSGIGAGQGTGRGQGYGSGSGFVGGGRGRGIGLGNLDTKGHGAGTQSGNGWGGPSGPQMGGATRFGQGVASDGPVVAIDPNGRFSTSYRPGGGTLEAFQSTLSSGRIPVAARQLVGDVGASYAPQLPLEPGKALAHATHLERSALPPDGGEVHLRIALRSTERSSRGRERLALSLVMDTSGSMSGQALAQAKQAARRLVAQLRPSDTFSLVTFSSNAQVVVPTGTVASRRGQIETALTQAEATGGTNIGAALDMAYGQARRAATRTGAVPVVLLLSDGQATEGNTDRRWLAGRALEAFQHGVQTSTFGLGQSYDGELMSAVAADGAGGYYYLRHGEQIGAAFRAEIEQRLDPAATAVEIRIKLAPDVSVLHVYGSQRLGEIAAARERAKEVAADQQAAQRQGIERDRQQDRAGGMRFFIPAFARADRYALLLKLDVPAGSGSRQVGTMELRYKDRVFGRNIVEERAIEVGYARSDAASAGTIDPSVARTVQGHLAGEDLLLAAQCITRGDAQRALAVMQERALLLRRAAAALEEPAFINDANRFERMLGQTTQQDHRLWNDPRALALVLESAGRSRLQ